MFRYKPDSANRIRVEIEIDVFNLCAQSIEMADRVRGVLKGNVG